MNVNRERKRVWQELTSVYMDGISLDSVIAELQGYRDEYGEHTRLEKQGHYGSDDYYYAVMYERDETDAEMQARIAREEAWAAEQFARDQETYERLKTQFGGCA